MLLDVHHFTLPFSHLNLFNRVLASSVRVSDESRFKAIDEVRFVGGGSERGRQNVVREDNGVGGERVVG
jgi:hypothetical protein